MFKFLSGRSGSRSRASSPGAKRGIKMTINIPSYGGVFMTQHRVDGEPGQGPTFVDRELSGELEIWLPKGYGKRRCRAIRMKLRNVARLNMKPGRGWEEDCLFERSTEIKGAIVLEEGLQRFNFTIVVPYELAPYDTHAHGSVNMLIHAEIEGLHAHPTTSSVITAFSPMGSRSASRAPSRAPSPAVTPAATPRRGRSPERQSSHSSLSNSANNSANSSAPNSARPSMVIDDDGIPAPRPNEIQPSMTVSWSEPVTHTDDEVEWVKGTISTSRTVTLLYNPEPSNGVSKLDEGKSGDVPGLGVFNLHFTSDTWTVCAVLRISFSIPQPSPATTIYYARVLLEQRTDMVSPRDDSDIAEPIRHKTNFVIWEKGVRPPPSRPTRDTPALWRGTEAQGYDIGGFSSSGVGRLPNDETGRPSTLEGIITPIKVHHQLIAEVWYSVFNEDVAGAPLSPAGHGQLRMLRVEKPVIVPSCAFIPDVVELPSYESHAFDTAPCPVCGTKPEDQACRTCMLSSVPHPRHDLDPTRFPEGVCPRCEKRYITDDVTGKWADCACGLSLQQLESRMGAIVLEHHDEDTPPSSGTQTPMKGERERQRGRQR